MYKLQQWAAVQELYLKHQSIRSIARTLGISRNTVKKLIKMKEQPKYHRSKSSTKIDAYKDQMIEWRSAPNNFNGTRIFRELEKRGYTGSIGPVYRYLAIIDEDTEGHISSKATVRIETPPGDQAQFDWSEYEVPVAGVFTKVYCFSMILAASRKKVVCFSLKQDADAIYEAIQELFDQLGGVTLELLIDNPKALVEENDPKSEEEIKYNPYALLLAKHLSIELNACPCYWPRKKGKIERPFNYIEEQFIKGNSFASMEDLNTRGKKFVNEWCDDVHTTTKRIPNEVYAMEERAVLRPVPDKHFRIKELQKRIISPDLFISVDGSKYTVPAKYALKTMYFRVVYGFRIEIYDKNKKLVLTLEKSRDKGSVVKNPEHYADIAPRTSTSIPQIRRDFTEAFSNGKLYLDAAEKQFQQPTHYARKILELLDVYDAGLLDEYIGIAVKENKLGVREFRQLVKEKTRGLLAARNTSAETCLISNKTEDPTGLTRNTSYYEGIGKEPGR